MTQIISPQFLLLSTLLIGVLNLLTPFCCQKGKPPSNFLLIIISSFFFFNILIIDWLFIKGLRVNLSLIAFANYSVDLHLEGLGLVFLTLLGFLWNCALLYTTKYLALNKLASSDRFLFFLNLSVLIGSFIALSANLFTMFVCYELLTLSTAPLINHGTEGKAGKGLYRYLKILMVSGMVLFLPAIIIIYNRLGHGDFSYQGLIEGNFSRIGAIGLLLMFIFGIAKTAIYPLHKWLPAAMVAPYPVSALLHAVVVVKSGLFCVYKILVAVFGLKYLQAIFNDFNWVIYLPVVGIFYSSLKALKTDNIKMILAYSTINQLNIALMSAFMFTPKSILAATLHMVSHSFSKICLFYAAGNFYSLNNTIKIKHLLAISNKLPKTSFIFLIASFSLIGLPPLGGFISKFYIMMAAAATGQILVMVVVALSSLFSGFYITKMLIFIYHLPPSPDISSDSLASETRLPTFMLVSLSLCLVGVILFFFIQKFISELLSYI